MKTIQLVVHCYSEEIPIFASMLTAQLSSLFLWTPKDCHVLASVCTTPSDDLTIDTVEKFIARKDTSHVSLETWQYSKEWVFRRGAMRNEIALHTKADIVWFIDADYMLGDGCLDALAAAGIENCRTKIVYPRVVNIHRSHQIGDQEIARIVPGELFTPDLSLFEARNERMAIGGLQIVTGDTARKYGYCNGLKWSYPLEDASIGFQNTREDMIFRKQLGGSSPIDLPNVYRLRHSESAFESSSKRLSQTADKT